MHKTQPSSSLRSLAVLAASLGATAVACAQAVPVATQFKESGDGIGHMLVVPYYTVQGGNATLLNIVNTDRTNGKAVKVRFRGASNADDVFNFTLFLSPGDVWAAEVSQNPGNGLARLYTPDDSCTLPTNVNRDFTTARLDPAANVANESREGYVDIITMADLVPGTAVYTATKHVNGQLPAACSGGASAPAALQALLSEEGISAAGFSAPTTGLFANWSIFNVADATSWAGKATAIAAVDSKGVAGAGKVVVYPQALGTPSGAVADLTSDPLLRSGAVAAQYFDLPDLSTPYVGRSTATEQAAMVSGALAKSTIKSEFFTDDGVQAQTDWVFSFPTRRYNLAMNYAKHQSEYTALSPEFFMVGNTPQSGVGADTKNCVRRISANGYSRAAQLDLSDRLVAGGFYGPWELYFCGAVSVWSVNAGDVQADSALAASVVRANANMSFSDGWVDISAANSSDFGNVFPAGLPVVGAAYVKANNPNIGTGISGNFGLTWPLRFTRSGDRVR